ncbi:MAG: hypothetical protein Q8O47_01975 [Candidatus Bathyarchaeota archaeon]|nr:hypothetical protein [Candidatus Bathyarchaeota archaeon]
MCFPSGSEPIRGLATTNCAKASTIRTTKRGERRPSNVRMDDTVATRRKSANASSVEPRCVSEPRRLAATPSRRSVAQATTKIGSLHAAPAPPVRSSGTATKRAPVRSDGGSIANRKPCSRPGPV